MRSFKPEDMLSRAQEMLSTELDQETILTGSKHLGEIGKPCDLFGSRRHAGQGIQDYA
jgi:hypothetical protein